MEPECEQTAIQIGQKSDAKEEITRKLPDKADETAPDGLEVRLLARGKKGNMAHFHLPEGKTGRAVQHKTAEEIWFFVKGSGLLWRDTVRNGRPVEVSAGTSVTIPVGTKFQVRSGEEGGGLSAVSVTMPPWPGDDEAIFVDGFWQSDL